MTEEAAVSENMENNLQPVPETADETVQNVEVSAIEIDPKPVEEEEATKVKKAPLKRIITSKNLKKFSDDDLRTGLQELLKKGLIPHRPEFGNINKLQRATLFKYVKPWAVANLYKTCLEVKEAREKSAPVFNEQQKKDIEKLSKHSKKNLEISVKELHIDVKNMYSIKKEHLIQAVVLNGKAKETLSAVKVLSAVQEDERIRSKEEEAPKKKRKI
jgi:hypothetical protein